MSLYASTMSGRSAMRSRDANVRAANVQSFFYPVIGLMKGAGLVLTILFGFRMMAPAVRG